MAKKDNIASRVKEAVLPLVEGAGYTLWDVTFYKEVSEWILEVLYVIQLPYLVFNTKAADTELVTASGVAVMEAENPIVNVEEKSIATYMDGFLKLCLGFNQVW